MPDRFSPGPYALPKRVPAPFFVESLPCESCGRPSDKGRYWNAEHELWIGVECVCNEPDEPVCPALEGPIMAARSVQEIVEACKAHREYCSLCNRVKRKEARKASIPEREPERKAA